MKKVESRREDATQRDTTICFSLLCLMVWKSSGIVETPLGKQMIKWLEDLWDDKGLVLKFYCEKPSSVCVHAMVEIIVE